jgi:hypothetical protein
MSKIVLGGTACHTVMPRWSLDRKFKLSRTTAPQVLDLRGFVIESG